GRRFLDSNPALWLHLGRSGGWMPQLIMTTVLCCALAAGYLAVSGDMGRGIFALSATGFGWLLGFCMKILILVFVARSFATEKEDGSLELLLTTPISNRQIVRAKILSVLARFGLLYALGCVLQLSS